jgi:hypothetical protein
MYSPGPSATPGANDFLSDHTDTPLGLPRPSANICQPDTRAGKMSTGSEAWEMLSDSGASLMSPSREGEGKSDSMRSWKSARNGQKLDEFGGVSSDCRKGEILIFRTDWRDGTIGEYELYQISRFFT